MATAHRIPTDPRFIDLTGKSFGRLFVESYAGRHGVSHYWNCLCRCGLRTTVYGGSLKRGATTSCGCFHAERTGDAHRTHGMRRSAEYRTWQHMKKRCHDPRDHSFHRYGGRGIAVCDRWRKSFVAFYEDMGPRPSPKHSIDRIDNSKGYSPENCRWTTADEQAKNRRSVRMLTYQGITLCIKDWARRTGLDQNTIAKRIARGLSIEAVLDVESAKRYRNHSRK